MRKSDLILKLLQNKRARGFVLKAAKNPRVRRAVTRSVQRQLARKLRGK